MLQGPKIDNDTWVQDVAVEEDDTGIDLTIAVGPEERPTSPSPRPSRTSTPASGPGPDVTVRVRLDQPPDPADRRPGSTTCPGSAGGAFEPAPLAHPVDGRPTPGQDGGPVRLMANGLVTVAVDPADGTFAVDGLSGFGRLVDGGDLGDSYNYSPPGADSLVDAPESVTVRWSSEARCGPRPSSPPPTAGPTTSTAPPRPRVGEHEVTVVTTTSRCGPTSRRCG